MIGIRSCAPLASFLTFYLNLVCEDVTAVNTNSSSEIFEQLIRIGEEDVIIGISFPRYSMRTLKALEFASNRKAKVITLTDSIHSPMNLYSSCNLIARSDMASIVDSLVAPLSVVNALIVALCMKKQKEVVSTLEMLEKIWGEYQVYSGDELNPVSGTVSVGGQEDEEKKFRHCNGSTGLCILRIQFPPGTAASVFPEFHDLFSNALPWNLKDL